MTDTTQGQDAPNDNALFNEAVQADTLDKFENPPPVPQALEPPAPKGDEPPKPTDKPDDTAPVPSGRFREEADARRRAERERDDLRAQLNAFRPQPPQQQPPKVDLFENPDAYMQQRMEAYFRPVVEAMQADASRRTELMSRDFAVQRYGEPSVSQAYNAMHEALRFGDQGARTAYEQMVNSHDPYGVIVRWHKQGETLKSIGGDLEGYTKRILGDALKDPEFLKQALDAAKGHAAATGNSVARPVKPVVASSPSLANIGAGGGDTQIVEPSDDELFRAAVTAKRR